MAKYRRRLHDAHAANSIFHAVDVQQDLCQIVYMALGIDAPGEGETNKLHRGRHFTAVRLLTKHDRANLYRADATLKVKNKG